MWGRPWWRALVSTCTWQILASFCGVRILGSSSLCVLMRCSTVAATLQVKCWCNCQSIIHSASLLWSGATWNCCGKVINSSWNWYKDVSIFATEYLFILNDKRFPFSIGGFSDDMVLNDELLFFHRLAGCDDVPRMDEVSWDLRNSITWPGVWLYNRLQHFAVK